MHELYLHPFLRAVQADVASVMCSYNLINNSWACQNSKTQKYVLSFLALSRSFLPLRR
jgi:beta-glucosidase